MDISQIRIKNLRAWADAESTRAAFCKKAGIKPSYLSQMINGHRNIGEKTARSIEQAMRRPISSMDRSDGSAVDDLNGGININVLGKAIQLVELAIKENSYSMNEEEKANIMAVVYDEILNGDTVSDKEINMLLRTIRLNIMK